MTDTALYTALNTVAQCAAALAALIGFLGMWRLDRLRDERRDLELALRHPFRDNRVLAGLSIEELIQQDAFMAQRRPGSHLDALKTRWDALPGAKQRLMRTLRRFLHRTLLILALAISGLVVADVLYAWVLLRWLTGLLIILASISLYRDTAAVVREAARSIRSLVILALLLALTTPAWAGTTRCTTYEERSLGRLQTLCSDGTRAIHTWNRTLSRWESTLTPPPGQTCTGQLNPKTRQWEGRCR